MLGCLCAGPPAGVVVAAISPFSNDSLEPADLYGRYGRWEGVLHDRALRDLPYRIERVRFF
jgi:hypothetical protein